MNTVPTFHCFGEAASFTSSTEGGPASKRHLNWPTLLAKPEFLRWRQYIEAQFAYRAACGDEIADIVGRDLASVLAQLTEGLGRELDDRSAVADARQFLEKLATYAIGPVERIYQVSH